MKEKRSVLVGWGLSYMIVLLIPIISIFINYAYNTRIIKGETIKANELILDNLRDNFDKYLQEEKSFYTYIFSNFVCRSVAVIAHLRRHVFKVLACRGSDLYTVIKV